MNERRNYLKVNKIFYWKSKDTNFYFVEKQPLLPAFGEPQSTQYQRAERALDDDEQRELENKRYYSFKFFYFHQLF